MKKWLIDRFLPMWAKETVLAENRHLRLENRHLQEKLERQEAYIQGVQAGLRAVKRISIYNGGGDV